MLLKKLFKRSYINKKKIFLLVFFILIILILFFTNQFFLIRKIEVIGGDIKTSLLGLEDLKNKNILLINEKRIIDELIEKNPSLSKIVLTKKYPNKLVIEIRINQPLAVLEANQGFFFLDGNGKIIVKKKDNQTTLPLIKFYQNFYYFQHQAGEIIDYQEILTALYLLKTINDLGLKVDTIDIAGVHMVAFNLGNKKIVFSLEKDRQVQEYQLVTIIKQFKIEGRDFINLDLRFDKPVIKLE